MKNKARISLLLLSCLSLTSCNIRFAFMRGSSTEATSSVSNGSNVISSGDGYYQDASGITANINYKTINQTSNMDALPSTGDIPVLVIPVELTDYPFLNTYTSEAQLADDLDRALNGNGEEDTKYWESLSSFYKKSSFGKLNLSFEIAPIYQSTYSTKSLASKASFSSSEATTAILRDAVDNYKNVNGATSTKKFDSDSDGFIDSVMLIYSSPSSANDSSLLALDPNNTLFWAYCYWDYEKSATATSRSPIGNSYFWCSYDFLYQPDSCSIGGGVDSHVFCHETGHLLGLDDYYSYDSTKYCYTGYADMMEGNYCDHNVYSKNSLGWVSPYVVTDSCSITIKPSQLNGDCIIVADSYEGIAFDEYLILELFTPDELNYADSHTQYQNGYPICFTEAGIKLFHVDSRLTSVSSNNNITDSYMDLKENSSLSFLKQYQVAATNSTTRDLGAASNKGFDLITMITSDKTKSQYGKNSQLFQTGDVFTMENYYGFFPQRTTFNNGNDFPYNITFNSVDSNSATITFEKLK